MDLYLQTAVTAAKDAGKIFKTYFGRPKNVGIKNNDIRNSVTEVDTRIEKLIRSKIKKQFLD